MSSDTTTVERRAETPTMRARKAGKRQRRRDPEHLYYKDALFELEAKGELVVDDPMLAAEQFASMCKGFGDLERRYEAGSDPARDRARIEGAVEVFLRAYGT